MTIARKATVIGKVQGVFYRAWTREQARELDISGWVRNLEDGNVEALLEGEKSSVDAMIERMRSGSPAAQVERIKCETLEPTGRSGFDIVR